MRSAKHAFATAIELNQNKFEARVQLSEIYIEEGNVQDALDILEGTREYGKINDFRTFQLEAMSISYILKLSLTKDFS